MDNTPLAMMAGTVGRACPSIETELERFERGVEEDLVERISPPGSAPSPDAGVPGEGHRLRSGF